VTNLVGTLRSPSRWRTSRRRRDLVGQVTTVLVLLVGAFVLLLPFEWMLATSLSKQANVALPRTLSFWPPDPSLFNYEIALTNLPMVHWFYNSVVVTVGTTFGYVFLAAITGYAFAKGRFPGKRLLFLAFLSTLMIPFEVRMIPLYLLVRDLHLNDSLAGVVVPVLAGGLGTFLMRQYISTIPDELIDAARVDGAGEFRIFRSIVLPLCKPVLATLGILSIIWRWNDLLWPLLVLTDRDLYTVTLGLATSTTTQGSYAGVSLATTVLATLPLVIAYLVLQRHVIRAITNTGLKG
jgi:multiple sugar transport system permease protein